jgi:hypothetical protein
MRSQTPIMATIIMAACLPAFSQTPQDRTEAMRERTSARMDSRSRRDDLRDLARIKAIAARYDAARAAHDDDALVTVRAEMRTAALNEIEEGRVEAARLRAEVAQDGDKAPSDRHGSVQVASMDGGVVPDRVSRHDDTRGAAPRAKEETRRLQIAGELRDMPASMDEAHFGRERALLSELVTLAKPEKPRDVREDRSERAANLPRP